MILGIDGLVGGINFTKITAKSILQLVQTGLNLRGRSLQKCFHRPVRQIPHEPGQVITSRRSMGGIAKTDPLYPALKDNMFSNSCHKGHFRCFIIHPQ